MKHTPGPWKIWNTPSSNEPQIIIESDSGFIAQTLAGNDSANGDLIAKAPELLKVLKQLYEYRYEPDKLLIVLEKDAMKLIKEC